MRAFDILTNPNTRIRKDTIIGGVLTLVIFFITIFLFINEYFNFQGLKVTKTLYLDPHPLDERIKVTLKIKLRNAPCGILSLDLLDDLRHHQVDISINKKKIDSEGKFLEDFVPATNSTVRYENVKKDLDEKKGCMLEGEFDIDKVSGNFHISFHNYMEMYRKLVRVDHDHFMKLNLSYEIEELLFGSKSNENQMPKIRKLLEEMNLDVQLLNNYVDHKQVKYEHFIGAHWMEIIPYKFRDNRDGFQFQSYLHSFNRKIKPIDTEDIDSMVPNLEFHYRFSTLSAKYEVEVKKMFHFLLELIAIIGALFAFFQIFTNYSHKIYEAFKKE